MSGEKDSEACEEGRCQPEHPSRQGQVRYERHGASAVITIDRQSSRNAIDGPAATELEYALRRFETEREARVLVIAGAGEQAFCSGADLKQMDSFADRLHARGGPLGFTRLPTAKPAIAAISGWCVAGGLEIALWCDLRIAAAGARLGFTERRFGVPLIDGGTQRLPRIVGLGRALDLILTGRILEAEEALSIGLVNEVVPAGEHLQRALALAQSIGSFPQRTMLADRSAAIAALGLPLDEGLALEARSGAKLFEQARAGAASFVAGAGRGGRPLDR